jgi:hypothetical protein
MQAAKPDQSPIEKIISEAAAAGKKTFRVSASDRAQIELITAKVGALEQQAQGMMQLIIGQNDSPVYAV